MSDQGERDDESPDETVVEILGFEDESGEAIGESPPASAAPPGSPTANERRLEFELAAERERYLRLRADLDNFRKRAERERAGVERFAVVELARELLPVVDNFERALGVASGGDDLRKGVEMILRQLEELLRRLGLTAVVSVGERFDPAQHEAVMQEESDEVDVPTVVAELQRGYRLSERLIRPAMVKVAMPRDGGADSPDAG